MKKLLALTLALCLLAGSACAEKTITLTFTGDCTIGNEDYLINDDASFYGYVRSQGYGYFFEKVKDFFAEDDLTVVNFEGVLWTKQYPHADKAYCFRGLPEFAQILPLGSVEAANLDNNHTNDYGSKALTCTKESLESAGVAWFDNVTPYIFEKDGIKIALFGMTRPQLYGVRKTLKATLTKLREEEGVDAIVFTPHLGQEYDTQHNGWQTTFMHKLIDAGADLVVAHHPHIIQGLEVYNNRYILYSVGNFVFGGNRTIRDPALSCLVPRVELRFDDDGTYLGQKLLLYAANTSGDPVNNDYQPRLVDGEAADTAFALLDADSPDQEPPIGEQNGVREYAYLPSEQP